MNTSVFYVSTPLGKMSASVENNCICGLRFTDATDHNIAAFRLHNPESLTCTLDNNRILKNPADLKIAVNLTDQLTEYFRGNLKKFSLNVCPCGTEFQKKAWSVLTGIDYGTTLTYKEQAIQMNSPKAYRAVGGANGRNPVEIVIPCHRVIGSDGSLTGFSKGIRRKQWLLDMEKYRNRESS
jgi:O-6-methylguanine DNA methyltransferase